MTQTEVTTAEKLSKLSWSISTSALVTFFVQLTFLGSVFILFLNALGLSKSEIGFLLSLLPFTGLIALFIAPLIARFGYKRTFFIFNALRVLSAAFLLATPWVISTYGPAITLAFITAVVIFFSVTRSVVITAYYPWAQEYIPSAIQGKYAALNNLFATLAGFLAVLVAGFVIDFYPELGGFMTLIVIGLVAGAASIWTTTYIPGGAPVTTEQGLVGALRATLAAFRDRGLVYFLVGLGLITLAATPLLSFVPLFMQEVVGLSSGNVVLIQTGWMLGGLVSTYLWGWTADRYGSRPIMLSGICLYALLPLLLMLMPRHSPLSLYIGLAISFLHGVADMGWVIGSTRLLFISIVPPERKSEYTALYYACVGVFGGISQLLAGQLVQLSAGVSGTFFLIPLDAYTGLFGISSLLSLASLATLRSVRSDTLVTVEEFAGMFLRGNPLAAMTSLLGYHFARDESSLVAVTERLGQTRSPFTVDELLTVLADPRFNVRYEAIISIARTRRDPRLTQALIDTLHGTELALSNHAAWALGRVGDSAAIPALREGLNSPYHSLRANSARALGRLKDHISAPLLRERLHHETDKGLQMAYASALGNLGAQEALPELLELLYLTQNEGARRELALSLARLGGDEGHFINLLREARVDLPTATAQAMSAFRSKLRKSIAKEDPLIPLLEQCTDQLARGHLTSGAQLLRQIIDQLPPQAYQPYSLLTLQNCAACLGEFEANRSEYILLALHILVIGWQPQHLAKSR